MCRTGLFFIGRDADFDGIEGDAAKRVCKRLAGEADAAFRLHWVGENKSLTIRDMCTCEDHDLFIFMQGNIFIARDSLDLLARIAMGRRDLFAVAPVANLSRVPQQIQPPPFFYQTIPAFRWVGQEIYRQFWDEVTETDEIDDFCFTVKRDLLMRLPGDARVTQLPDLIRQGIHRYGIAKGAYVHRYGNLYESSREDLLPLVPVNSRDVLDIGCANGLFGEILKRRQECRVTGVDSCSKLLDTARMRLDTVIAGDIEEIVDNGILSEFDCIVCGDVLEHLDNPWKVVSGLRRYLKRGGRVVASVPNVTNWAIIHEMLKGRWDYVPFTILSGTHIRFFTKETLRECFEDAGYRIRELYFQSFGLPPGGARFIEKLKEGFGEMIDEEALKASEIVIAATRD